VAGAATDDWAHIRAGAGGVGGAGGVEDSGGGMGGADRRLHAQDRAVKESGQCAVTGGVNYKKAWEHRWVRAPAAVKGMACAVTACVAACVTACVAANVA
jgi:hypothetical protein